MRAHQIMAKPVVAVANGRQQFNRQRHEVTWSNPIRQEKVMTEAVSEAFDPALWSIATVLSAAVVYLACLV